MGISADLICFICIKKVVFGADFEVNNTLFTFEKFYEKFVSLYLYLYTYRFSFCFQNYIMEHYCEMNKSGLKFQNYTLFRRGFPPENYEKYTSR